MDYPVKDKIDCGISHSSGPESARRIGELLINAELNGISQVIKSSGPESARRIGELLAKRELENIERAKKI